jgi:hypothetical protein
MALESHLAAHCITTALYISSAIKLAFISIHQKHLSVLVKLGRRAVLLAGP